MFGKNFGDLQKILERSMKAYVLFYKISFRCAGYLDEEAFSVTNSNLAEAFILFVERFPDADLSSLDIHCEL